MNMQMMSHDVIHVFCIFVVCSKHEICKSMSPDHNKSGSEQTLKTLFNIVEERLNFFLNFDVSAV